MNWPLIAEHFADGTIDRNLWAIEIPESTLIVWQYIGPELSPADLSAAEERMGKTYGVIGDVATEIYSALDALGIPTVD